MGSLLEKPSVAFPDSLHAINGLEGFLQAKLRD